MTPRRRPHQRVQLKRRFGVGGLSSAVGEGGVGGRGSYVVQPFPPLSATPTPLPGRTTDRPMDPDVKEDRGVS